MTQFLLGKKLPSSISLKNRRKKRGMGEIRDETVDDWMLGGSPDDDRLITPQISSTVVVFAAGFFSSFSSGVNLRTSNTSHTNPPNLPYCTHSNALYL